MSPRPCLPSSARYLAVLALAFAAMAVSAQSVAPAGPQQVTLTLDRDLVTFVKVAAWAAGIFLAVFAALAVGFFGFDVRAARKSLLEASDDIRTRMESIRKDHEALGALKERLEKLGGELVGLIEDKTPPPNSISTTGAKRGRKPKAVNDGFETDIDLSDIEDALAADEPAPTPEENKSTPSQPHKESSAPTQPGPLSELWDMEEKQRERIREVLASSEFEWSTVGTVSKKTGLSEEAIEKLALGDPFVQIGHGRQGAMLLRLKEFNYPGGTEKIGSAYEAMKVKFIASGTQATQGYREALWEHAQQGKGPTGKVLGGG
ncbi:hypothetical protein [Variovorax sp. PAMC26660]|uniref:hypothetical protein n=1 Tax=Variovorax sp. PAMC26660 TaxID=2762322 RepID=UPI00164DFBF1|nr:hypothetical protein [Variovorax sp. PAMC26660]QNK69208.1 hypothetical protein H7F35_05715 [Variovorax sp. PAMC26660]